MTDLLLRFRSLVGRTSSFLARPASLGALWVLACVAFVIYSLSGPGDVGFSFALCFLLCLLVVLFLRLRYFNRRFPDVLSSLVWLLARVAWLVVLSGLAGLIVYLALLTSRDFFYMRSHSGQHLLWVVLGLLVITVAVAWIARGPGWLFGKDSSRFYGWATLFVFSMIVLFYSVEKWRGKRLWAAVQQEMVARGEKPGLSFIIPPAVPEEQDAAKAPIFAPLSNYEETTNNQVIWRDRPGYERLEALHLTTQMPFQTHPMESIGWLRQQPVDLTQAAAPRDPPEPPWIHRRQQPIEPTQAVAVLRGKAANTNINISSKASLETALLGHLAKSAVDLEDIRLASHRPYARFKTDFEKGMLAQSPHAGVLSQVTKVFDFRAVVELNNGRTTDALEDIRCALRLSRLEYQQSFMGDFNTAAGMTLAALQPIWEGLAARQWTDVQITTLQAELEKVNPLGEYEHWVRDGIWFEMDFVNQIIPIDAPSSKNGFVQNESKRAVMILRSLYPNGWSYQDQADLYWQYRRMLELVDIQNRRVFTVKVEKRLQSDSSDPFYTAFLMARTAELNEEIPLHCALAQTSVNLARVACALERYRLAQGGHPNALEALSPQFMEKVPHDILNGEPLHYRLDAKGHYALYSVGWNQTDDQGTTAITEQDRQVSIDPQQGDWVWEYPNTK